MKKMSKALAVALAFGLTAALTISATAQDGKTKKAKRLAAPENPVAYESAPKDTSNLGTTVLTWDDGSFENGLGPTGGHYDGQFAMRFGGDAATTALVPFRLQGAYLRIRAGNPGLTAANVNIWHPLATNGFPANPATPAAQVAAGVTTGVTQMIPLTGPVISTANGSLLLGLGGLGTTGWFIDRDSTGPNNDREFAGSAANNTLGLSLGPGTLGSFGFSGNYFLRLLVDGNVPVELEAFSID